MMFTKEQASLIWTLFRLQNSERKISEFTKLRSNQKDLTISQLIYYQDDEFTSLNLPFHPYQYVFCSAPFGVNGVRFSAWDYKNDTRRDFNPLDYISFEDKV